MNQLIVCAADIGSVSKGRFAWCRIAVTGQQTGADITIFADRIADDLTSGQKVAVGFECPLFVPVSAAPEHLGKARSGEGARSWSASAGTGALATGLVQCAWVFERLAQQAGSPVHPTFNWEEFSTGDANLLIWEAFVSNKIGPTTHEDDAKLVAMEFWTRAHGNTMRSDLLDNDQCSVYSLVGAALLRARLSTELHVLRQPCLVIKVRT